VSVGGERVESPAEVRAAVARFSEGARTMAEAALGPGFPSEWISLEFTLRRRTPAPPEAPGAAARARARNTAAEGRALLLDALAEGLRAAGRAEPAAALGAALPAVLYEDALAAAQELAWDFGREACHAPSALYAHALGVVEAAEARRPGAAAAAARLAVLAERLAAAEESGGESGCDEGGEDGSEEEERGNGDGGAVAALKTMLSCRLLPCFTGRALFPRAGRLGVTSEAEANCEVLFTSDGGLECSVVATRAIAAGEPLLLSCAAFGGALEAGEE
jgi:hypothetical protein